MKKLLNSPPLVEDDSEDNMIKNVGWVQGDEQLYQYIKVSWPPNHWLLNGL